MVSEDNQGIREIFGEFPRGNKQQTNTLEKKLLKQKIKNLKNENRNRRRRGSKQKIYEKIKPIPKEIKPIKREVETAEK